MKRALVLCSATALVLGALALIVFGSPHRPMGANWSPRRLCEELARVGEVWEWHPGKSGAVVCKRPGDPTPWAEILEAAEQRAEVFGKERARLHIVPDDAGQFYGTPNHVQLGRLLIRGHPEELARVVAVLQP